MVSVRVGSVVVGVGLALNLGLSAAMLFELRAMGPSIAALAEVQLRPPTATATPAEVSRAVTPLLARTHLAQGQPDRVSERLVEQLKEAARSVDPQAQRLARIEEIAAREEEAIARADVLVQPMLRRATTPEEWAELGRSLEHLDPPELREETIRRILVRINNRELIAPPGLNPIEALEGIPSHDP